MQDLTFHARTLEREFQAADFAEDRGLLSVAHRAAVVGEAVDTSQAGFTSPLQLEQGNLRGKNVYRLARTSDRLVLRLVTRNIRRLTGVKQSNRDAIIRSLQAILAEGVDYRIYKLDIRNFYETVAIGPLVAKLAADTAFPRDSLRLLQSFFGCAKTDGIEGLPRGIALSATLAEYVMRSFDRLLAEKDGVYFYARFVDDILILTLGDEDPWDFLRAAKAFLFPGLHLNSLKTRFIDFKNTPKGSKGPLASSFDFLGYQFNVHERQNDKGDGFAFRQVYLDMATKKAARLKTRIVKSFHSFLRDGNFEDLRDRLKLLSGNYNIYDQTKKITRNSGLYCNYRLIHSDQSLVLPGLDSFLRALILSPTGIFANRPKFSLTKGQRSQLLRISFVRGFKNQVFY